MESDNNKEAKVVAPEIPPQQSPTDTSNWDDRPTVAPDGKTHIRTTDGDE